MTERKYPRDEFTITAAGIIKPVTLVKRSWASYPEWDTTDSGKSYNIDKLYPTHAAAVAAGRKEVEASEARLVKMRRTLDKKIANLNKAESKS